MADAQPQGGVFAAMAPGVHPWALLPGLCDRGILTEAQAGEIVMAHIDVHRQTLLDLRMLINDTRQDGGTSITCDLLDRTMRARFLTDMPDM